MNRVGEVEGGVTIRAMTADDAEVAADLATQLGYPSTADEMRARLAGMSAEWDAVLVSERAGTVTGWIHGREVRLMELPPIAEVWGLVVDANERGQGTGLLLLSAVEAWARDRGLAEIQVRSNIVRERAHRFYLREGFETVKTSYTFKKSL